MNQQHPHPSQACGTRCGNTAHLTPHAAQPHTAHSEHHPPDGSDPHAGHDHSTLPSWPRISAALVFAALSEAAHWSQSLHPWLNHAGMAMAVAAIALAGLGVYKAGIQDILRLKLGIHALMAIAVTGAFAIGQWPEAAMVMALYAAAERIEDRAMDRARYAIRELLQLAPETAEVIQADGSLHQTPAGEVPLDSLVRITPGARIPLDGEVASGASSVNQAPITGESAPVDKAPGDPVFAGSINQHATLTVRVTAKAQDSLLTRIVHAVEQAQATRAPTQRFVDRFAQIYTPIVLLLAALLALLAPPLLDWTWHDALYQALALLVIACPCALVLSTPVTVVSALTTAAQRGILMKGGRALENARKIRALALDKTGTLTTGSPTLVHWQIWNPSTNDIEAVQAQLAATAWQLAHASDHPVSRAIASGLPSMPPDNAAQELQALPGRGIQATLAGQKWTLANSRWVREQSMSTPALEECLHDLEAQGHTTSLLADSSGVRAIFAVADPLRPEAKEAIVELKSLGIHPVVLSGDNQATVNTIAAQADITHAQGALLPEDKQQALRTLQARFGPTAMTGDGINDAPALAQADLGFAMGGRHSTGMAMETADIVLMNDDLRRIPETLRLSRSAHVVLWQNITMALGIKALFFGLALTGLASMWLAVVADMGVSLLVVANGLRLRRWQG